MQTGGFDTDKDAKKVVERREKRKYLKELTLT